MQEKARICGPSCCQRFVISTGGVKPRNGEISLFGCSKTEISRLRFASLEMTRVLPIIISLRRLPIVISTERNTPLSFRAKARSAAVEKSQHLQADFQQLEHRVYCVGHGGLYLRR